MDDFTDDTQELLRRVMHDAGIETQAEFAQAIGMSLGQTNRWLTGAANPPARRIRRAIEAVGLDPSDYGFRDSPRMAPKAITYRQVASPAATAEDVRSLHIAMQLQHEQITAALRDIQGALNRLERRAG